VNTVTLTEKGENVLLRVWATVKLTGAIGGILAIMLVAGAIEVGG